MTAERSPEIERLRRAFRGAQVTIPDLAAERDAAQERLGRIAAILLPVYDDIRGRGSADDLDDYLTEKRGDVEFVAAYVAEHVKAARP